MFFLFYFMLYFSSKLSLHEAEQFIVQYKVAIHLFHTIASTNTVYTPQGSSTKNTPQP